MKLTCNHQLGVRNEFGYSGLWACVLTQMFCKTRYQGTVVEFCKRSVVPIRGQNCMCPETSFDQETHRDLLRRERPQPHQNPVPTVPSSSHFTCRILCTIISVPQQITTKIMYDACYMPPSLPTCHGGSPGRAADQLQYEGCLHELLQFSQYRLYCFAYLACLVLQDFPNPGCMILC